MATSCGKVREILFFFKVKEFCKMVREILNSKKVKEKSGIFLILAHNCFALADILSILSD